jgi:hypothetical protein
MVLKLVILADQEDHGWRPACMKSLQDSISTNGEAPFIPATRRSTDRRITVQASPGNKVNSVWKITNTKRTGRMSQVVWYLPSKCEALSSTPSTRHTRKKKTKEKIAISRKLVMFPFNHGSLDVVVEIYPISHRCTTVCDIVKYINIHIYTHIYILSSSLFPGIKPLKSSDSPK